jgi:hypothetical protein
MTLNAKMWYLTIPIVAGIGVGAAVVLGGDRAARRAILPAGTTLVGAFERPVSADANQVGDTVLLRTIEPLQLDGRVLVPVGSEIRGVVTDATSPDWGAGPPQLGLRFTSLTIGGRASAIATERYWFGTLDAPMGGRVVLPAGERMTIRLTRPVTIR